MLSRKVETLLKEWKETHLTEALLVTGAHQVGKTFSVKEFIANSYENVVEFDLSKRTDVRNAMSRASSSEELFMVISAYAETKLVPHKTVIFIDNVQECEDFIPLIKHLVRRIDYDYILVGTSLESSLAGHHSASSEYLKILTMYPLDFEEFCWAHKIQNDTWSTLIQAFESKQPVPDSLHQQLLTYFHWYLLVGGMPSAVDAFIKEHNVADTHEALKNILALYKKTLANNTTRKQQTTLIKIYEEIPRQLDTKTKRFGFTDLAPRGTYDRFKKCFDWLSSAGLTIPVYNLKELNEPLNRAEMPSFFKLFMNDVGLLSCTYGNDLARQLVSGDLAIAHGSLYENAVAQELRAHGLGEYFYRTRKDGELDFVIQYKDKIVPIEIRSGKSYKRHSAVRNILALSRNDIGTPLVFTEKNLRAEDDVTYLPIYMIAALHKQGNALAVAPTPKRIESNLVKPASVQADNDSTKSLSEQPKQKPKQKPKTASSKKAKLPDASQLSLFGNDESLGDTEQDPSVDNAIKQAHHANTSRADFTPHESSSSRVSIKHRASSNDETIPSKKQADTKGTTSSSNKFQNWINEYD